jgi:hypothetical protein
VRGLQCEPRQKPASGELRTSRVCSLHTGSNRHRQSTDLAPRVGEFLYHHYECISVLSSIFLENIDAFKHSTEDSNKKLHDPDMSRARLRNSGIKPKIDEKP